MTMGNTPGDLGNPKFRAPEINYGKIVNELIITTGAVVLKIAALIGKPNKTKKEIEVLEWSKYTLKESKKEYGKYMRTFPEQHRKKLESAWQTVMKKLPAGFSTE